MVVVLVVEERAASGGCSLTLKDRQIIPRSKWFKKNRIEVKRLVCCRLIS